MISERDLVLDFTFTQPSTREGYFHQFILGKGSIEKKTFSFGHCPNKGGGLPMPEFFGPLFRSAFLVNKKSLFLQKCQCIELLTVFRLHICSIL